MASQVANPTLIRNIRRYQVCHTIRVRVGRIWRPRAYKSDAYDGLHYLLIDEMGDTIEPLIEEDYYKQMIEQSQLMEEGLIYDIFKFNKRPYKMIMKTINHDLQLLFNRFTEFSPVNEGNYLHPRYGFHLLQFHEFTAQLHNQKVLADLYGFVKSITTEFEVPVDGKMRPVREIVLANLRREEIKVTLWGDPARNLDEKAIEEMPQPVFAVFTSLTTRKYDDEIIGSGADHTCVIINPHIHDKEAYKTEFSRPGDKVRIIKKGVQKPDLRNIKTVAELYELDPKSYTGETVCCKTSIHGYPIHNGWWYKGCSSRNYKKLLKKRTRCDDLICDQHGVQKPTPCYRVHMIIEDTTNEITVTLMGREAEKLFGTTCEDLVNRSPPDAQQTLPKEIEDTIGQTYLFEITFNKYGRTVKSIISEQQTTATTEQQPTTATPEKTLERKRPIDAVGRALFTSERQESESTSKSQKQKIN